MTEHNSIRYEIKTSTLSKPDSLQTSCHSVVYSNCKYIKSSMVYPQKFTAFNVNALHSATNDSREFCLANLISINFTYSASIMLPWLSMTRHLAGEICQDCSGNGLTRSDHRKQANNNREYYTAGFITILHSRRNAEVMCDALHSL